MSRMLPFACLVGCCFVGGVALAQADPDNAIKYRQQIFQTLGANLTAVVMNLKGEVSFPDAVAVHARTVADTAPLIVPAMAQDTAGQGARDTDALAKIWDNWDDFTAKADDLEAAAVRLAELAGGDDMAALGAQVQEVGAACKACHDDYRD